MPELTQERLKELFNYNPDTGIFTRRIRTSHKVKPGDIAGYISAGYVRMSVDYKMYMAHRLAWLYMYGELPIDGMGHINHVRSDNRLENLRLATHALNNKNKSMNKSNSSGVVGVMWHKATNKWLAKIGIKNKAIHLGVFKDIEDAISARKEAEDKYGFHPNHGKECAR